MNRSYIVHGPTGCGKTRNAERIAAALGLSKVQDNWTPTGQVFEPFDTLYLTASNGPWPDQARHVLSFSEAMGRVPDAVVEPKSRYIHRNGVEYEVLMIANGESTSPKYPPTIVYRGVANGKVWARPACDWGRSMQLIQRPTPAKVEGTEQVSSTWLAQLRSEYRQFAEAVETLQAKLQSALAQTDQLEHERDLLGQALGECIEAAGITTPGVALTGPQLLLFAEDLKAHIGGLREQLADTAVPMQPLIKDDHGVARFKANKIVNHLLDYASERGCDMTELAKLQFPDEDRMQFAQLIGYSVSGYSDLSYVSDDSRGLAYAKLDLLAGTPDVADAQVEQVERPEVVGTAVLMLEAAGWRNDDPKASVTSVSELLSCIVGELRAENAKLSEDLNRLSIIRARLNLRLDFALDKISKLESRWPHGESPEERFEHYISNTIDRAPEPLRRLGNWLSHVLDEDQWTTAERMLTGACVAAEERAAAQTQHSVPDGLRELLEMLVVSDLRKIRYAGAWRREVHNRASSILALLAAAPASSEES